MDRLVLQLTCMSDVENIEMCIPDLLFWMDLPSEKREGRNKLDG